jgi:hypothetical protein
MFNWFGKRQRDVERTTEAISKVATLLETNPPGFVGLMFAQDDFEDLREPGGPSTEEIRQMNFQMLAAAYLLKHAKDSSGDAGFVKILPVISAALCQKLGLPKKHERAMQDQMIQYFAEWEPALRVEKLMGDAIQMPLL